MSDYAGDYDATICMHPKEHAHDSECDLRAENAILRTRVAELEANLVESGRAMVVQTELRDAAEQDVASFQADLRDERRRHRQAAVDRDDLRAANATLTAERDEARAGEAEWEEHASNNTGHYLREYERAERAERALREMTEQRDARPAITAKGADDLLNIARFLWGTAEATDDACAAHNALRAHATGPAAEGDQ